jgi:hypothetical protein
MKIKRFSLNPISFCSLLLMVCAPKTIMGQRNKLEACPFSLHHSVIFVKQRKYKSISSGHITKPVKTPRRTTMCAVHVAIHQE